MAKDDTLVGPEGAGDWGTYSDLREERERRDALPPAQQPSADGAARQAASSEALGPAVATTPLLGDTERTGRINEVPALVLGAVATVLDPVAVTMQISANPWGEPGEVSPSSTSTGTKPGPTA